jgi:hypothetical protein
MIAFHAPMRASCEHLLVLHNLQVLEGDPTDAAAAQSDASSLRPVERFAHTAAAIAGHSGTSAMCVFGGVNPAEDLADTWMWQSG